MINTGDHAYDQILARVAEIEEEQRLANPAPVQSHLPNGPANFTAEVGGYRLYVMFERIGDQFLKSA